MSLLDDNDYEMPFPPPNWGYGQPSVEQPPVPDPSSGAAVAPASEPTAPTADATPATPPGEPQAQDVVPGQVVTPQTGVDLANVLTGQEPPAAAPGMPIDHGVAPPWQVDATSAPDAGIDAHQQLMNNVGGVAVEPPAAAPPSGSQPGDPDYMQKTQEAADAQLLPSLRDKQLASDDEAQAQFYKTHPEALARDSVNAEVAKRSAYVAEQAKANLADAKQAQADWDRHQRAIAKTAQDSARVQQDATVLANQKIDPDQHLGIGRSILNVVALTLGGVASSGSGGRNLALEQLNKAIDNHIATQKDDLANQWRAISVRKEGIADDAAREADNYREATTIRVGTYQRAMNDLATKMQDFDPRGSQVRELGAQYQQIASAQGQALQAFQQKQLDNHLKVEGAYQKQQEIDETAREHDLAHQAAEDKLAARSKGGSGTGVGGLTTAPNQAYAVPTGFFDPFDAGQPVIGKRQIGGKGEDPKERNELATQLQTYKKGTDLITKMRGIADELGGGGKGIAESVWKGRRSTLGAQYDAAKEELTSILTKAIGDRPTSGQLELQAHRIPDRKTVFEAADPGALLGDQQDALDHAFSTDLDTVGVNAAPIISNARKSYQPKAQPAPEERLTAAQQARAAARTPGEVKDADAALDAAKGAMREKAEEQSKAGDYIRDADLVLPKHEALAGAGLPPDLLAEVNGRNKAAERLDLETDAYHKLKGNAPKPTKLKGDDAKAAGDHDTALGAHAARVVHSRAALQRADDDVAGAIIHTLQQPDFGGIPPDKVAAIAKRFGEDPSKFGEAESAGPFGGKRLPIDAQEARGAFAAKLDGLTPFKRRQLMKTFFGGE